MGHGHIESEGNQVVTKMNPRGPKRVLDEGPKKSAIIRAAKRIAREEGEVTYSAIVSACPSAVINDATGEPVDKKAVFSLFREEIYGSWLGNRGASPEAGTGIVQLERILARYG